MRTARSAILRTAFALGLAFVLVRPAPGETPCAEGLKAARTSYEQGLLEEIPDQLKPCFNPRGDDKASPAESFDAYKLLAEVDLVLARQDEAHDAAVHLLRLDPDFKVSDPPALARLLDKVRREQAKTQVASASKISENLRETPATVVVVTAREIEERGYLDLEAVLHDLPGFDISRSNGQIYANIYQRGFRSNHNDRVLILVDGVEQNSLVGNIADLSRQYPMSAVARVEVVYGPASTIYGANAYSGVINILTKAPEDFLDKEKRYGADVQLTAGSLATRAAELTLAGQRGDGKIAWSLTARKFDSDEPDLSHIDGWKYDFDAVDYKLLPELRLTGDKAQMFCSNRGACSSPLYQARFDAQGKVIAVELTDAGAAKARELDKALGLHFTDPTSDVSLFAKLKLGDVLLGLQIWRTAEGSGPQFISREIADRNHGSVWTPRQTSLFLKYSYPLNDSMTFDLFARYKQEDLDTDGSSTARLLTYANGGRDLQSLVDGTASAVEKERFSQLASQLTGELSLRYHPVDRFNAIVGIDLRKGSAQFDDTFRQQLPDSSAPSYERTDVGLYGQMSYQLRESLLLVAGGRLDHSVTAPQKLDSKKQGAGYGDLFSPRLSLIYSRGDFNYKAIYSEAFKDPSYLERYSQDLNEKPIQPNPRLQPERLRNFEISAGWQNGEGLAFELAGYQADFRNVIVLSDCETCEVAQFMNASRLRIRGLQASAELKMGERKLFLNYTVTQPFELDPRDASGQREPISNDQRRIGDIAGQRLNLGFDTPLPQELSLDLRMSYVGVRPTGEGTTVTGNKLSHIPPYAIVNAALSWQTPIPGTKTKLQLIVNNLFDRAYRDPGVVEVTNVPNPQDVIFADSIPQPGRTFYLRLLSAFPRPREVAEPLP